MLSIEPLICTRKVRKDSGISTLYTILDTKTGMRGFDNRLFTHDYISDADVLKRLAELQFGEIHVHRSSSVKLDVTSVHTVEPKKEQVVTVADALEELISAFQHVPCPVCSVDCASANPTVTVCPNDVMRRARQTLDTHRATHRRL